MHRLLDEAEPLSIYEASQCDHPQILGPVHNTDAMEERRHRRHAKTGEGKGEAQEEEETAAIQGVQICDAEQGGTVLAMRCHAVGGIVLKRTYSKTNTKDCRYLRAAEVGRPPSSVTYELSLKIRTPKNSPVLRSRLRLPYPIKNDTRIAVICKEGSGAMHDARTGGAVAFGEESLFEMIKTNPNKLPFNRLICHIESEPALKKAGLGRILGPKGLMPSLKTNTITKSVKSLMHEMVGAENYRERIGAIRMPIGNIQFTPKMLSENVKTLVTAIKENVSNMEDRVKKDLIEVVLTSTNGPGFSLNGGFNATDEKVQPSHLSTAM